jgi:hypothetical protein
MFFELLSYLKVGRTTSIQSLAITLINVSNVLLTLKTLSILCECLLVIIIRSLYLMQVLCISKFWCHVRDIIV